MINKIRSWKHGFTMVELLVVLVIIGILAAVATPMYIRNTRKAKASEAVATMSLIRQALREYNINNSSYFAVTTTTVPGKSNMEKDPPAGAGLPDDEVTQYFSNRAFSVELVTAANKNGASGLLTTPDAVNFIIKVDGSLSDDCKVHSLSQNCAVKPSQITDYRLEMDNAGRVAVSYENGATGTWSMY